MRFASAAKRRALASAPAGPERLGLGDEDPHRQRCGRRLAGRSVAEDLVHPLRRRRPSRPGRRRGRSGRRSAPRRRPRSRSRWKRRNGQPATRRIALGRSVTARRRVPRPPHRRKAARLEIGWSPFGCRSVGTRSGRVTRAQVNAATWPSARPIGRWRPGGGGRSAAERHALPAASFGVPPARASVAAISCRSFIKSDTSPSGRCSSSGPDWDRGARPSVARARSPGSKRSRSACSFPADSAGSGQPLGESRASRSVPGLSSCSGSAWPPRRGVARPASRPRRAEGGGSAAVLHDDHPPPGGGQLRLGLQVRWIARAGARLARLRRLRQ